RLARVLAFGDCALSVDPNAEELAAIAVATAHSFTQATNEMARVALLSYSTLGSGLGASVNKVRSATELARVMAPDLMIDGELQFDAAFLPEVAAHKGVNSSVAGRANVFIFPNLDAGNIGYKIAQRLGGGQAVGPILQGLLKPANDLSRGCSADDIFEMIKITAAQAQAQAPIIHAPVFEKL
ncbi:MAG: phosphate acyltransferase, partial [Paracoccaceae bacterium]